MTLFLVRPNDQTLQAEFSRSNLLCQVNITKTILSSTTLTLEEIISYQISTKINFINIQQQTIQYPTREAFIKKSVTFVTLGSDPPPYFPESVTKTRPTGHEAPA